MFDTLKYSKQLQDAGFTLVQAEAQVKLLGEFMDSNFSTKQDMKDLRVATQQDLKDLRVATQQDLRDFRVATQQDMKDHRAATAKDIAEIRQDMKDHRAATAKDIAEIRQDMKDHRVATAKDIADFRGEVQQDFKELRADFRFEMKDMEHRLTVKMGAMFVTFVTVTVALIKLL